MNNSKYIFYICLVTFLILSSFSIQARAAESASDSVNVQQINELRAQVDQFRITLATMKESRDDFFKINTLSLTTARNTILTLQAFIQWILMIAIAGVGTGLWALYKKWNSSIDEIKKNAMNTVDEKIKDLGLDHLKLQKEFDAILKEIEIHNLMFQLNSVETEQKKAIGSLVEKPIKDNSLIFDSLQKTSLSNDSEIRAQSMLARARCGDRTGISDLKNLTKSDDPAMQEAATDALDEL